jgi:hypothetical protein
MTPRLVLRLAGHLADRRTEDRRLASLRAGVIASVIANTHRDPSKTPEAFVPSDFFTGLDETEDGVKEEQSDEDMLLTLKGISAVINGQFG